MFVVSNRLPLSVYKQGESLRFQPSIGGLATGLSSVVDKSEIHWVGWPGIATNQILKGEKKEIITRLNSQGYQPVFLSNKDVDDFYYGFCNKTIWPLFHYFCQYTVYEEKYWQAYKRVNEIYLEELIKISKKNDTFWIHDYQLMLLPGMIRKHFPEATIGFFLHIPFPSFELFRLLPWRNEILNGLLGSDLVGFHTYDYVRHFLSSCCRIIGLEHSMGMLKHASRVVKVDAFPMGIDYEKYSGAVEKSKVKQSATALRKKIGDRKIIISIDRLDYTKGIIQRLEAFDLFLSENPKYKEKVIMILLAVPSRISVDKYETLRKELEGLIGRINGEHGTLGGVPVWYLYKSVSFERLIALYNIADVALVTPLRDGMNLVAKEFVATKVNGKGVLVLSEMAGAASELGEAITVNSNDKAAIVKAIKESLEMPEEEQRERNRLMQERLSRYTVVRWANDFVETLKSVENTQKKLSVHKINEVESKYLSDEYKKTSNRLFLLDYDGTLIDFVDRPDKAAPDESLYSLLERLSADSNNEIVVISGRDKEILDKWLGGLDICLIAEHGGWIKQGKNGWESLELLENSWKESIRPILELYADRTPGATVEEKDFSLVWHFRKAEPELAYIRSQELRDAIINITTNLNIGVYEGSKIIEVKRIGINKGKAAQLWLKKKNWGFVFAAGDDYTDEDLFSVLSKEAFSIKVGLDISKARFNVGSVQQLRNLLMQFIKREKSNVKT